MSRTSSSDPDLSPFRDQESEVRLRTLPEKESDLFEEQLRAAEQAAGELARSLIVRVGGVIGGEPALLVLLQTAPDGPYTPAEDVWSEPQTIVDLAVASADSVRSRVEWVLDVTQRLRLAAARVEERWSFGPHPFRGAASAVTQLLDARVRRAELAFDRRIERISHAEVTHEHGSLLVVTAELRALDRRREPIVCELLRQAPDDALRSCVADWTARRAST